MKKKLYSMPETSEDLLRKIVKLNKKGKNVNNLIRRKDEDEQYIIDEMLTDLYHDGFVLGAAGMGIFKYYGLTQEGIDYAISLKRKKRNAIGRYFAIGLREIIAAAIGMVLGGIVMHFIDRFIIFS